MLLSLDKVTKDYFRGKERVPVLKDVCLSVEEGDYVAIMGPSGSGKTTLMNIMGCLDRPTSGSYYLDGEDVTAASEQRLTALRSGTVGFVFQSFYLLPKLTALENAALPLLYAGVRKKERLARAAATLTELGLEDRLNYYPNQLSGGQQQRVAIARAMVTGPKVLFADEPTGALDSASGDQIMALFDRLHEKGCAVVTITHERSVAERARLIYHMLDGVLTGPEGGDGRD